MYSRWQLAIKYLRYFLTASNGKGHGTHSPFIFKFITSILNSKEYYPEYETVEAIRQELLLDSSFLEVEDLGAGSTISTAEHRTVASIAKNAAKPPKFGQLLFRMVRHYRPQSVLELGTSLGVSTSLNCFTNATRASSPFVPWSSGTGPARSGCRGSWNSR